MLTTINNNKRSKNPQETRKKTQVDPDLPLYSRGPGSLGVLHRLRLLLQSLASLLQLGLELAVGRLPQAVGEEAQLLLADLDVVAQLGELRRRTHTRRDTRT